MKRNAFAVALLLALASVSSAQNPVSTPNALPEGAKTISPERTAEVALALDRQSPSSADPRVCLEFSSTAQVIACAEKYRPRRRHA
jgi:hypothetical protein